MSILNEDVCNIHIFGTHRESTKTYRILDCDCHQIKILHAGPLIFCILTWGMVFIVGFVVKDEEVEQ